MVSVPVGLGAAQMLERTRVARRPRHPFLVRHKPHAIQPMLIAPVLPGETMRNLLLQARAVTDPIKNPLTGWWLDYYFFYVKLQRMGADFKDFLLDPAISLNTGHTTASNVKYYHNGSTVSFVRECLKAVVEDHFRLEGEAWDAVTIDGLPAAMVVQENGLDSFVLDTQVAAPEVDQEITVGVDDKIAASEIEQAWMRYSALREMNLATFSWEDFLRSYGVKGVAAEEDHKPELVRFVREWTYPSNTVDPATGTPSSAVSWTITERADKDRFFKEPGFIFGVTCARPKLYLSSQTGSLTQMMSDAWRWLPAVLENQPGVSMIKSSAGAGPIPGQAGAYWVDIRDLLSYGEQFVGVSLASTDASLVALPTSAGQKHYPTEAMMDALFKADPNEFVRQDGVVQLNISSRQMDVTRST